MSFQKLFGCFFQVFVYVVDCYYFWENLFDKLKCLVYCYVMNENLYLYFHYSLQFFLMFATTNEYNF